MYRAVAETLQELSADPKYLGAQIVFMPVLHTWGQDLHYHPHIHTVVLAGGLTKDGRWKRSSDQFFLPVYVVSKKFRGKFLYYLKNYYREGKLAFYNDACIYEDPTSFQQLIDACYGVNWYSYMKETFSGPLAVMEYLGRYTHRIAISNHRILSVTDETIRFKAKDYRHPKKKKVIDMNPTEFIRRFLMHVLPKGFVKVRHYGILANRNKKTKLETCRLLSRSERFEPRFEGLSAVEVLSILLKKDLTLCPSCQKDSLKQHEGIP